MKNTTKAIASFIATVIIAFIACTINASETIVTVLMLLTLVTGGAFVYYVNRESSTGSTDRSEAVRRDSNGESKNVA